MHKSRAKLAHKTRENPMASTLILARNTYKQQNGTKQQPTENWDNTSRVFTQISLHLSQNSSTDLTTSVQCVLSVLVRLQSFILILWLYYIYRIINNEGIIESTISGYEYLYLSFFIFVIFPFIKIGYPLVESLIFPACTMFLLRTRNSLKWNVSARCKNFELKFCISWVEQFAELLAFI